MARQAVEVAAIFVDSKKLVPWEDNPRINEKNVKVVAESIRQFGFGAPIVARKEDNRIIAGHTRWKAAMLLGLDKVPVRFLDVSIDAANKLALADNKIAEGSDWDTDKLRTIMTTHWPVDEFLPLGWSQKELDKLLAKPLPEVEIESENPTDAPTTRVLEKSYQTSIGFESEAARDQAALLIATLARRYEKTPGEVVLHALQMFESESGDPYGE